MAKKRWVSLLVVLALVFVMACSNNNNEPENTDTPENTPPTSNTSNNDTPDEPAVDDTKYEISFMDYAFDVVTPDGPGLDMINERFNVDLKVQKVIQDEYVEKLTTTVASGEIPDIMNFRNNQQALFQKFASQGAFLPLEDYIKDYPNLAQISDTMWDQFKIDGHIYAIPHYNSPYPLTMVIRQDWLENLGLEMPTSYEELAEVALAFTKEDPDQDGLDNTYGFVSNAQGKNVFPFHAQGPYWNPEMWLKNGEGEYTYNRVGEGWKSMIEMFHNMYKEGAFAQDFATYNFNQMNMEFYSGKAGIYMTGASIQQDWVKGLMDIHPGVKIAPVPPFVDPNGNQGFWATAGFHGMTTFSVELEDDPGKVRRILEMIDFGKTYYPLEERTPANVDYDWKLGGEGKGYDMINGNAVQKENAETAGLNPYAYLPDNSQMIPYGVNTEGYRNFDLPLARDFLKALEDMQVSYPLYFNPISGIISETYAEKGQELDIFLTTEQVKMIVGNRPISDWDAVVQEWMDMGGADVTKEYNEGIKARGENERWVAPAQ